MEELIGQATQALGAIAATALVALVVQVARKFGLQVGAQQQARLEHYAQLGIKYAEEQARKALVARGEKLAGSLKQSMALEFIVAKLPRVNPDEARKVIEALLPDLREGLTKGVGELGNALRSAETSGPSRP